jgi:hypothetical protein
MYRPKTRFISTENADFGKNTKEISTLNVFMIRLYRSSFSKAINMTKMYVVAKCVLTALGIYAVNVILIYAAMPLLSKAYRTGWWGTIDLLCAYALICVVFYFALFRNQGFTRRLAGLSTPDEKPLELPEVVKALRITVIFCGLMLLPGAMRYIVYLKELPAMSRALLFAAFGSERFSNQLPQDSWALVQVLNPLLRLCLSAYLIIGAPAYVRWQARKIASQKIFPDNHGTPSGEKI